MILCSVKPWHPSDTLEAARTCSGARPVAGTPLNLHPENAYFHLKLSYFHLKMSIPSGNAYSGPTSLRKLIYIYPCEPNSSVGRTLTTVLYLAC
jgi:hypothetical protein